MDDARYGRFSRYRSVLLGVPPAMVLISLGTYWTLLAWGVVGDLAPSRTMGAVGPIVAGFGASLGYVSLRRRDAGTADRA